jgi:hypothetical protein
MDKIINQFRRIYADTGKGDIDFTEREARLKEAQNRVIDATKELVKASENLNNAALNVGVDDSTPN